MGQRAPACTTRRGGDFSRAADKGPAAAIAVILADDCVKAGSLTMLGSERAAFRLLDTLKARGALRELTGRQVFRLYGV